MIQRIGMRTQQRLSIRWTRQAGYALNLHLVKNTSMNQQQHSNQNSDDSVTTSPVLRAFRSTPLRLLSLVAQDIVAAVEECA
jgi:hypothetical protein